MPSVHMMIPKRNLPVWPPADMELVDVNPVSTVVIPLLGFVAAGLPMDICHDNETVSVPAHMVRKETYALRVRGDSMVEDNVQDGDIIVVRKQATAENGQSVVAMINGDSVTLKRFYLEPDGIRLQPANPSVEPIILRHEDVQILGIVVSVLRIPA
ncbi:MAG: repressor LexA [Gammaproteobacteria bacterium]|nr:repressor LexA [Gammaproteobacteria bacterium]